MKRWSKVGVVVGGYVLAVAAAAVTGWAYDARLRALPHDTSGGMYAGGQLLAALVAFLVVALVPTLLALWFLRRHTGFWNGVAVASIAFAALGLIAVVATMAWRDTSHSVPFVLVDLVGLSQLLGVPLWIGAFVLFAVLAPSPAVRRKLSVAVALELVIGVFALVHWFAPRS